MTKRYFAVIDISNSAYIVKFGKNLAIIQYDEKAQRSWI